MKRFLQNTIFFLGFVLFFGTAIHFQRFQSDKLRQEPEKFRDWLYLPSSAYVQWTTLGYDQIVADALWLRSIQSFGATFANKETLPQLTAYFDVITDLDPHFLAVYRFANLVIGEEGGDHEKGLAILEKGMEKNPDKYLPAYDAAFFTYWTMKDGELAKYYTHRALKTLDCPEFVRGWLAFFDQEMGRYMAAYQNYFSDYARYHNASDAVLSRIRYLNLRRSLSEWYLAEIRKAALDFEAKNGRSPTMKELEDSGAFLELELPDWTALNQLIRSMEESGQKYPDSETELQTIASKFVRKGWTRLLNPASDNRHFPGYILWPGQRPFLSTTGIEKPVENPYYVLSEIELSDQIYSLVRTARVTADNYKLENGTYPPDASFLPPESLVFAEPWGGEWIYNPQTGDYLPSSKPNIVELYQEAVKF